MQNITAQQSHCDTCFALTAWYLVGSPGVLPQLDTEAFLWAKKAANTVLTKAMYAISYLYEVGIGTQPSMQEWVCAMFSFFFFWHSVWPVWASAIQWYKWVADLGDKHAIRHLKMSQHGPLPVLRCNVFTLLLKFSQFTNRTWTRCINQWCSEWQVWGL